MKKWRMDLISEVPLQKPATMIGLRELQHIHWQFLVLFCWEFHPERRITPADADGKMQLFATVAGGINDSASRESIIGQLLRDDRGAVPPDLLATRSGFLNLWQWRFRPQKQGTSKSLKALPNDNRQDASVAGPSDNADDRATSTRLPEADSQSPQNEGPTVLVEPQDGPVGEPEAIAKASSKALEVDMSQESKDNEGIKDF